MCYFICQAPKITILGVLTWFLILGKIQDRDHCWWRHRPAVAPPPLKYTSSCWEDQRLSTEGKESFRNIAKYQKTLGGGVHQQSPLYHDGGMNLRVRQRVNFYSCSTDFSPCPPLSLGRHSTAVELRRCLPPFSLINLSLYWCVNL